MMSLRNGVNRLTGPKVSKASDWNIHGRCLVRGESTLINDSCTLSQLDFQGICRDRRCRRRSGSEGPVRGSKVSPF